MKHFVLMTACLAVVGGVAFFQDTEPQNPERNRDRMRQQGPMMMPEQGQMAVCDGKIFVLIGRTLYRVNPGSMEIEKTLNLRPTDMPKPDGEKPPKKEKQRDPEEDR